MLLTKGSNKGPQTIYRRYNMSAVMLSWCS